MGDDIMMVYIVQEIRDDLAEGEAPILFIGSTKEKARDFVTQILNNLPYFRCQTTPYAIDEEL